MTAKLVRTIRFVDSNRGQRRASNGPDGIEVEASNPRDLLLGQVVDWFSKNGIGDTSLRTLAAQIGTSHRMLNYHFGSREGLLAEVVAEAWRRHRLAFEGLFDGAADPAAAAWDFWSRLADQVDISALHFELSAAAMQGHAWAAGPVREQLEEWSQLLAQFFERLGNPPPEAELLAHTSLAITRGTLEVLALNGDRESADRVMSGFLAALEAGP